MAAWPWLLGAAALALAVSSRAVSGQPNDDDESGGDVASRKQMLYWRTRQIAELTELQRMFLMLTAFGEGGYSTAAHNGSVAESAASKKAAENNPSIVAWAASCGVPPEALHTGSWSMFQLLAPYYTGTVREVFGDAGCPFADPRKAPGKLDLQIVVAIEHARDLQGYAGWQSVPTVGNLRLGWANPGFMGKLDEQRDRIDKYKAHAQRVVPSWTQAEAASFIASTLTRFPTNPAEIFQRLQATPMPTSDPG